MLPALTYTYHDSQLEGCDFGPRRELRMSLRLDPVWNPHAPDVVTLHFSSIDNFAVVHAFFSKVVAASLREPLADVIGLDAIAKGTWVVDLAAHGAVTILTPKRPREL